MILNDQADLTKSQIKILGGESDYSQNFIIVFSRFNSQLSIAEKKISQLK